MKTIQIIGTLFACTLGFATASAGDGFWQWAQSPGNPNSQFLAVGASPSGEVTVGGYADGAVTIGTNQVNGTRYGLIAKYDSAGKALWARKLVENVSPGVSARNFGFGNYIFSVINLYGSSFDPMGDISVSKLTANGELIYTKTIGKPEDVTFSGEAAVFGLAGDSLGQLFVVAQFRGKQTFGTGSVTQIGPAFGLYVAKFDAGGNPAWIASPVTMYGNSYLINQPGRPVCADGLGGFWLTMKFYGSVSIGTNLLSSPVSAATVSLAHIDSEGQVLWSGLISPPASMPGEGISSVGKIAVDGNGELLIFGNGTSSTFLARYNSSADQLWWKAIGPTSDALAVGAGIDTQGKIHLVGDLFHSTSFSGHNVAQFGYSDFFEAVYDQDGNFIRVTRAGGTADAGNPIANTADSEFNGEHALDLAVDGQGNSYLGGYYYADTDFGVIHLNNPDSHAYSNPAAFIAKFDVTPVLLSQPSAQYKLPGQTAVFNVVADGAGPFQYQWFRGGSLLTDQTNATLTVSGVSTNSAGLYTVQVSNALGSTLSNPAALVVNPEGIEIELYAGLKVIGIIGKEYLIQATTDPASSTWSTLTNVTLTTSPEFWLDPEPANGAQRFYRTVPNP